MSFFHYLYKDVSYLTPLLPSNHIFNLHVFQVVKDPLVKSNRNPQARDSLTTVTPRKIH